ncbi:alginate O-acetylation protein [Synergistales bacterium]|nr:alginate O-acetylation protein [Synergistales bacterium]
MLFNSPEFIFAFLPCVLLFYHVMASFNFTRIAMTFLTIASLFYYSWWDVNYLPLILASIVFNFIIGELIDKKRENAGKSLMIFGVSVNLLVLGVYKYTGFLVSQVNALFGLSLVVPTIPLPLAISFYTFTQIAYLADIYMEHDYFKDKRYNFLTYSLFITVFPQLIAGPILYHKDLIPQFSKKDFFKFDNEHFCAGITFFVVGLAKKVLIADTLSPAVALIFEGAENATFFEAWLGAISYTLQIYFDFSGYSEMAIGLCLMFNMRLPLNFDSPYRALSIIDFWRRWHMTLSSFLKRYLYIPLGGNRHGQTAKLRNLMITMLLGGLWHGAGWTFIVWGGLHGMYLVVNHMWRMFCGNLKLPKILSWLVTFTAVVVAWVFFRAENMSDAVSLVKRMFDVRGVSIAGALSNAQYPLLVTLHRRIIILFVAFALPLTCLPNIQRILNYHPDSDVGDKPVAQYRLRFVFLLGCLFFLVIKQLLEATPGEFLYFNF